MKTSREHLDRYDVAILSALATNTRLTTVEIANTVHLSRTAVSRRIVSLKRRGVLSNAGDVLNYELIGFDVRAVVVLTNRGRAASALKAELLHQPEVLAVSVIADDGSLSLDVIAVDTDHLDSFVESLQEFGDTMTKVIFAAEKSRLTLADRMQLLKGESLPDRVRL